MEVWRGFVVESKGHCFFCLDEISTRLSHYEKSDHGPNLLIPKICSLQSLSRYLEMDLHKLFCHDVEDQSPPRLIDKFKNPKLDGQLCEKCAVLNANFGTFYQKLEKIQIEVLASLNQIFMKLQEATEMEKLEKLTSLPNSAANSATEWKVDLNGLRTEVIEKCSRKITAALPRIKIQNFSNRKKNEPSDKFLRNCNSSSSSDYINLNYNPIKSEPEIEMILDFKMEYGSGTIQYDEDEGNYYGNSDNALNDGSGNESILNTNQDNNINPSTSGQRTKHGYFPPGTPNIRVPRSKLNPESRRYSCGLCENKFTTVNNYKEHYKIYHLNFTFKCPVCEKEFKSSRGYHSHRATAHLPGCYNCDVCNKRFTHRYTLLQHGGSNSCRVTVRKAKKKITRKITNNTCKICGKDFFKRPYNLKRHLEQTHSTSRNHVCHLCGKKFKRQENLLRHQRDVDCQHQRKKLPNILGNFPIV